MCHQKLVGIQINECSTKLSIKQNLHIVNDKLLMYNVGRVEKYSELKINFIKAQNYIA